MSRAAVLAMAMALVVAFAAGCGDDDGGSSASGNGAASPDASQQAGEETGDTQDGAGGGGEERTLETISLSKAEYVERAEKICSEGTESLLPGILTHIQRNKSGKSEEEKVAAAVQAVLVPAFQKQIDELHQLGAPEGDEDQVEAFVVAMLRSVESLERRNAMSLEPDLDRAFGPAGDLALDYGILSCGN